MQEVIERILRSQTHLPQRSFTLKKLAGEASYREYFRLQFSDNQTLIIMKMPTGYASISEEVTKTDKPITELPFINMQCYLKSLKISVPDIVAYSPKEGLLLLTDLGDQALEKTLQLANDELKIFFYSQAIQLLAHLQKETREHSNPNCVAFTRRFDESLLNWEFNHFLEYGIEDRFKIKMEVGDKKAFNEITSVISKKITQMPQGFVHRDFQSRNLIVHAYDLWVIDFQDALQGPLVYDLVALLRDSYIALKADQIEALQRIYLEKIDSAHPYKSAPKELAHDFDLVTLQRKLKDAGRFQYINTVKKNPSFLKNTAPSLGYVKEALARQKEYSDLEKLLKKYVPEFG